MRAGHQPRTWRRRAAAAALAVALLASAGTSGPSDPAPATATAAVPGSGTGAGDDMFLVEGCRRSGLGGRSVARVWDEALLDAIRRDTPAPTVHARNLFHVSAAMWDAWAAYDPRATGYLVDEAIDAGGAGVADVRAAREAALSYAAFRLLLDRYSRASGLQETFDQLVATMGSLCYRIDVTTTEGGSPAALGNRIAAVYREHGRTDGAREDVRYLDTSYRPANEPLVVAEPGAQMRDPSRWQPLALDRLVAQNGVPIPGSVQRYVGSHWGAVEGFALPPAGPDALPVDPGPPPRLGDDPAGAAEFREAAVDVIRASAALDPADGVTVDIGPGAVGDNSLGADDGDGHDTNPATGRPYAPNRVSRGDLARALAESWADGPDSETPPGHWNTIANTVSDTISDTPGLEPRIGGEGDEVDRLEWDVKLYLTLNGAVHDAAVAAWGAKGHYDTARPISMIRYLGGRGQSSDPGGPAYDPDGLPLADGLVEVVTPASSAPGERHEHLADYVGEVAVRSWRGVPDDPSETSGVGWVRAVEWVPYQRETFVTPAFASYVSGHSTFSRAAAEVLTAFTGSEFFPGGLGEYTIPAGDLHVESGPRTDVTLQWATYFDAADQAGVSRIYGGIHIPADDHAGRRLGATCGQDAWALAQRHFTGAA